MPFGWPFTTMIRSEQGAAIGGKRGKHTRRAANKRAAANRRRNRR